MGAEAEIEPGVASVLVVDDDAATKTTLCAILEDAGYEVAGANNGTEALEMLKSRPFNAIITDIRLPDVGGMEILDLVKETEPDIAVIMMTGYANLETAVEAVNEGAYAYFVKPVNMDELKTALVNALRQQRLSRENERLVDSLQRTNKLLFEANEELRVEIAEREQAEALYRTLADKSPVGVYIVQDKKFVFVNPQFIEFTGYTEEELSGAAPLELVHPEDRETVRDNAVDMLKGNRLSPYELRVIRKGGDLMWAIEIVASVRYKGKRALLSNFMDITERKKAEEALREEKDKAQRYLDVAGVIIVAIDGEGKVTLINKKGCEVLGYEKEEEIIGKNWFDSFIPSRLKSELLSVSKKILSGEIEAAEYYENPVLTRSGEERIIAWHNAELKDEKGNIIGHLSSGEDITERKRAQQEIEAGRKQLEDIMANVVDGIMVTSFDGTIVQANNALAEMHGYSSADELVGKKFFDLVAEEDLPKAIETYKERRAKKMRVVKNLENLHARKDGSRFPVMVNIAQLWDKDGEFIKGVSVIRDITERKKAEEALRQSEDKFRSLVENAPVGIAITTVGGPMITANKTLAEIFGYDSVEELLESPLSARYYDLKDRERWRALVEEKGKVEDFEVRLKHKDGSVFWASFTSIPQLTGSDEQQYLTVAQDITERRRMEQEIRDKNERLEAQNEELQAAEEELKAQQRELIEKRMEAEEANQIKSAFLAGMSHELRTPLNAVIGFSQLLLDEVPGKINEEQRQCLTDVLNSGEHLLDLINDILDLSKVEAGRIELELENLNLADVIDGVVQTMKPMLDNKKHRLTISVADKLPEVYADAGKLRQIFLNLLSNAAKFTPSGGELAVEAVRDANWCRVSVIDSGIGIDKKDQARIFEPFTQVDASPEWKTEGTGLGLALTRQFVEMFGGKILVESQRGKGSKFTFTIPLARAA